MSKRDWQALQLAGRLLMAATAADCVRCGEIKGYHKVGAAVWLLGEFGYYFLA